MKAVITIEKIDGVNNVNIVNDDYSPFELVGILEHFKLEILNIVEKQTSHVFTDDSLPEADNLIEE